MKEKKKQQKDIIKSKGKTGNKILQVICDQLLLLLMLYSAQIVAKNLD